MKKFRARPAPLQLHGPEADLLLTRCGPCPRRGDL